MASTSSFAMRSAIRALPAVLVALALIAHVLAGLADEGRVSVRPVGPLTVWVAALWSVALTANVVAIRLIPTSARVHALLAAACIAAILTLTLKV
jgi:hypothetical protein